MDRAASYCPKRVLGVFVLKNKILVLSAAVLAVLLAAEGLALLFWSDAEDQRESQPLESTHITEETAGEATETQQTEPDEIEQEQTMPIFTFGQENNDETVEGTNPSGESDPSDHSSSETETEEQPETQATEFPEETEQTGDSNELPVIPF